MKNSNLVTGLKLAFGKDAKIADFEFLGDLPCCDPEQSAGKRYHKSRNALMFTYQGDYYSINKAGIVFSLTLDDDRIITSQSQVFIRNAGDFPDRDLHLELLNFIYPVNGGIK